MPVMQTLDNRCQFENFVMGKANQLAHAAAIQVADTLESANNPLFIYGGVGLGKTHLLRAIGNQLKNENSQAKFCYAHATTYVSEVVRAFQKKQFDEFRQNFNSLDLLLIDDIQFMADKPVIQQEFLYTLDSLMNSKKLVVITCDTCPEDILGIEPRLISRFRGGLTVAIEPPELELRAAILLQKAIESGCPIGEDIAYFVAKHVRSDIRTLEGALKMIEARARFYNRQITIDLANEALFTAPFSKELDDKVGTS